MNLNKTRSAVLAALLAGVVGLAGCDKGAEESAPETPAATSEAPAAEPTAPAQSEPAPADSDTAEPAQTTEPAETAEPAEAPSSASETPAPATESSAAVTDDSSLPQTCQDYFKKAEEMVMKAGASADQMNQMIDEQRKQMAAIGDQAQLESSCKQALDMLEQQEQNTTQ
ncbi:hypothetical protein CAP48_10515 [Advenella sp. S44]|uniref:DUF5339 family protein n=1 Tax=Advenella sp. S44 TaxID=1982755 RepID=UPI000C2B2D0E|nr:DUF5339 family protein [Advenella sp. S44]PJX26412.1 hypothetical protein CAP48_10515 [Advenella sp. S44]